MNSSFAQSGGGYDALIGCHIGELAIVMPAGDCRLPLLRIESYNPFTGL